MEGRSRHSIARMFKDEKIAKRGGSLDWCVDEITRILASEALIGVRVYKGVVWDGQRNVHNEKDKGRWVVTPNAHEAIIDLDTFVRAQRLIRDRKKNLNFNAVRKHFSTLGGVDLLFCGKCGASFNSNIGPGFRMRDGKKVPVLNRFYVCGRRSRHRDCDNRSVRQEVLDGVVLRRIAAYVRDSDVVRRKWRQFQQGGLEKLIPLGGKFVAVEAEIAQLEQKEARLIDALGSGDMPKDIFGKHVEANGRRLKALREDRRSIKKRLAAFDQGFDESEYLAMLEDFHEQFGALAARSRDPSQGS